MFEFPIFAICHHASKEHGPNSTSAQFFKVKQVHQVLLNFKNLIPHLLLLYLKMIELNELCLILHVRKEKKRRGGSCMREPKNSKMFSSFVYLG